MRPRSREHRRARAPIKGWRCWLGREYWPFWGFLVLISTAVGAIAWHLVDEATVQLIVSVAPGRKDCERWAHSLQTSGLRAWVRQDSHLDDTRRALRVPPSLSACHTAVTIAGKHYVIEGHVPAAAIERLLREQPEILGLSVPGPPPGAGSENRPRDVWAFTQQGHITFYGRFAATVTE